MNTEARTDFDQGLPEDILPIEDLLQLHQEAADRENELAAAVERRRNIDRLEYRREVIARCEQLGTTPAELFGFRPAAAPTPIPPSTEKRTKRRSKGGGGEPKYRNPDNPAQTWPGRGRAPAWVSIQKTLHGDAWKQVCSIESPEGAM